MNGRFLVEESQPEDVFTPEDLSEEQRMIAGTASAFMEGDVLPRLDAILALDYAAAREALRRAGQLGLLGIEIPREYGGLGLGCLSACAACEPLARDASFVLSYLAHTGMGTLPIVCFGTEAQKQRYLPRFASGEWISSYSLSEASSGSDAQGVRTRAVASADGRHWILDGEKMWLTNAGIADVYVTFAKVNGERFSAFIVEKGMPGVSLGAEERKAGLKGSSTRSLVLSGATVPRENLLGKIGTGFGIAFGCLNVGRLKLATANSAAARFALRAAVQYGRARQAFGRPLTDFGLVKDKLARMVTLAYAAQAVVYRTTAAVDGIFAAAGGDHASALKRVEHLEAECAAAKVWCSEALDYTADESVQIFGAAGYVEDYPAERRWRDARVNRIFEGTNEINRLRIASRILRGALRGDLPLSDPAKLALAGEATTDGAFFANEGQLLVAAKRVALLCLGALVRRHQQALDEQQELLGHLADITTETYALESALLRARKRAQGRAVHEARLQEAAVRCLAQDALDRIDAAARRMLSAVEEGDAAAGLLQRLRALTESRTVATLAARRMLAEAAVEAGGDPFA